MHENIAVILLQKNINCNNDGLPSSSVNTPSIETQGHHLKKEGHFQEKAFLGGVIFMKGI